MAWRQPWDVACPRCKAGKGKVCRAPYTNNSLGTKAHGPRWDVSLGLRTPIDVSRPRGGRETKADPATPPESGKETR